VVKKKVNKKHQSWPINMQLQKEVIAIQKQPSSEKVWGPKTPG